MSKLVDKERLALLAKGLNDKMKAAVKAEQDRAKAAEEALQGAIDLKVAKTDYNAKVAELVAEDARIEGLVASEQERAEGVEAGFETRIKANEDAIAAINDEETGILKGAQDYADQVVGELESRHDSEMDAVEGRVEALEKLFEDGEGSVKDQIQDAIKEQADKQKLVDDAQDEEIAAKVAQSEYDTKMEALDAEDERIAGLVAKEVEDRKAAVEDLQGQLDVLDGDVNTEGSVKQQIKAAIDQEVKDRDDAIADEAAVIRGEMEVEAARVNKKIADDIAAESALRVAEEARIEGLVTAEAAKAREEEGKLAQAIADEQGRAEEAEADLLAAINKEIEDRGTAVAGEKERAEGQEAAIRQEMAAAIGNYSVEADENGEGGVVATGLRKEIEDADKALSERLDAIQGDGEGSIQEQIAAAIKVEKERAMAEEADIRADFAAADAQVLADAKAHADKEIAKLVDSAPEAMNTLRELAEEIAANESIYDAYVAEHATAMANMKTELQAEIDADVKVVQDELNKQKDAAQEGTLANKIKAEEDRAKGQEAAIRQELANEKAALQAEIDADVAAEAGLREAEDTKIRGEFAAADAALKAELQKEIDDDVKVEADRAKGVEAGFEARIAANEAFVAAQPAKDEAQNNRLTALEEANAEGGSVDAAIKAAQMAAETAQAAADKAQGEVDAVELRVDAVEEFVEGHSHEGLQGEIDAVEDRVDALETFKNSHSHEKIEQDIAANKAAIEKEVEDRAAAIEEALKVYSTTEEMKQVIGNVVSSLALAMDETQNKVVLKLGGVDGISLAEVSLDMATEDDINEILAGLDN